MACSTIAGALPPNADAFGAGTAFVLPECSGATGCGARLPEQPAAASAVAASAVAAAAPRIPRWRVIRTCPCCFITAPAQPSF